MNIVNTLRERIRTSQQRLRHIKLHDFARGYPRIYFLSVVVAALGGYGFLLLFPLAAIIGLNELFEVTRSYQLDIHTVSQALIWFAVLIFSIAMSHHIFTVRFELPKGVSLAAEKAPKLFAILENDKHPLFWPKFSQVLLSEHFELEIYKTPVTGIPLWCKNTLLIGFPVMQTLPELYFSCMLQRKLLQYTKGRNLLTNWLYQLQYIWQLYPAAFSQRKLLGEQLISGFFKLYAPFYKSLSVFVAQQEELAADTIALGHINDTDLFKSIESLAVSEYFFHKVYLPMMSKLIKENSAAGANLQPYSHLPTVFRKTVSPERSKNWLDMFMNEPQSEPGARPTLAQRMSNLGHRRIRLPDLEDASAAEQYFEHHYQAAAQLMDNLWRNKLNRLLKRRQKKPKPSAARSRPKPIPSN